MATNVLQVVPTYFPLDEVNTILKRIAGRNLQVPGLVINTGRHDYTNKLMVKEVRGREFALRFGVDRSGPFLLQLTVPRHEIVQWPRDYGLSYYKYVGTNWERDRAFFVGEAIKYHGKQTNAPRYLRYASQCNCNNLRGAAFESLEPLVAFMRGKDTLPPQNTLHTHRDSWRCPLLVHRGGETEYQLRQGETAVLQTADIVREMRQWLKRQLLPRL